MDKKEKFNLRVRCSVYNFFFSKAAEECCQHRRIWNNCLHKDVANILKVFREWTKKTRIFTPPVL